jgi:hypothetical protein
MRSCWERFCCPEAASQPSSSVPITAQMSKLNYAETIALRKLFILPIAGPCAASSKCNDDSTLIAFFSDKNAWCQPGSRIDSCDSVGESGRVELCCFDPTQATQPPCRALIVGKGISRSAPKEMPRFQDRSRQSGCQPRVRLIPDLAARVEQL